MKNDDFIVTPWEVKGDIDYEKLTRSFGVKHIDEKILHELQKYAGNLHYLLKRKIFFSHMYFDEILNEAKKGNKFYLYTGRAPSGPVHLGHIVPWIFTKWLQDKFDAPLLFQIPDEEKFLFKDNLTLDATKNWAKENILDIIALGFDAKKTKIFLDTEYAGHMYKTACMVAKRTTLSTTKALFGFDDSNNVGEAFYTCMQSVPAFLPTIMEGKQTRCLIPCAIDQDVHFRLTRDVATQIGFPKPATILSRFLPSLTEGGKMSSSAENTAIFTTDNEKTVRTKIMKYAFSGGRESMEEHRKKGGVPEIDVPYQYLTYFMEDSTKLKKIYEDYKSGKMLSGEIKEITVDVINRFLAEHQMEREKAKDVAEEFMLRD
ncbi:MAG: tryptophan--tRNA ligase [Candidatus Aenigmatarchaeota archaeon]